MTGHGSMEQRAPLSGPAIAFGTFRLFVTQRMLMEGDRAVRLGSRALEILFALLEHPGEIVSKARLFQRVWPDVVVEEGTLRVHIAALRKVLGEGHSGTRYIENVTGLGYRFVAPFSKLECSGDEGPGGEVGAYSLLPTLHRVIGRTEVVAALVAQVPKRRFVTIVGPGGIGKTTVAVATARKLRSSYPQGVYCVDLAAISSADSVACTIASTFGLPVFSADPLPNVVEFLAQKRLLLLLDNCEHVIESAARVAETVLRSACGVCLLATSREPLRAEGEWVHRLPPLELPCRDDLQTTEALGYAAIQLFVERAAASTGDFELRDEDVALVAEVCRKLDGLPLAIELAAACVDRLGLQGLAERIDDRLQLLRTGRRTAVPRHRTLRATLDWSYEILLPEEQKLLRRLAAFAGSFSVKSALAVALLDDMEPANVGDHLADLAGKSLLVSDVERDTIRYRLLDTTRSYALEKLVESGEVHAVRRKHAELCVSWRWTAGSGTPPCDATEQTVAEVRSALDWSFSAHGDACLGCRLIACSAPLWFQLSFLEEYRRRVEQALTVLNQTPARARQIEMELNAILGEVHFLTKGPGASVVAAMAAAFAIARETGDLQTQRQCLWGLYSERIAVGDYAAALDYAARWCLTLANDETAAEARPLGDRMLAFAYHLTGQLPQSRAHAEQALRRPPAIRRIRLITFEIDDHVGALTTVARTLWVQGFADQARRAACDAVMRARALDHGLTMCHALACSGTVEIWVGNREQANELANELFELARHHSLGHWEQWADCLKWGLAGDPQRLEEMLRRARQSPFHTALHEETLATFDDSLASTRVLERGERGLADWCSAELMRAKAVGMCRARPAQGAAAAAMMEYSLKLARGQGALAWELRIATSLAELWAVLNRGTEARELLQSVVGRVSEGETTDDFVAAQTVLKGLWPARTEARHADRSRSAM